MKMAPGFLCEAVYNHNYYHTKFYDVFQMFILHDCIWTECVGDSRGKKLQRERIVTVTILLE